MMLGKVCIRLFIVDSKEGETKVRGSVNFGTTEVKRGNMAYGDTVKTAS